MVDAHSPAPRAPVPSALALPLALVAGASQGAAHQRMELAPGAVLGVLLLLLAVSGSTCRRGFALGALFGAVVTASFLPQAPAASAVVIAGLAWCLLCGTVGLLGAWALGPGRGPILLVVALPLHAAVLEWLNGLLSPLGDYLGLAASGAGLVPLQALARWGGLPTVAAGLVGFASAGALLFGASSRPGARRLGLVVLLAWSLLAGLALRAPASSRSLPVAAVALAEGSREGRLPHEIAAGLAELTGRAAARGARLVVWPEAAVSLGPEPSAGASSADEPALRAVRAAAREHGVVLVAGVFVRGSDSNQALVFSPDGRILARYEKHHLIPGMEHYRAGSGGGVVAAVPALDARLGLQICFDDCFGDGARDLSEGAAQLMAVPTQDWPAVADRHRRLSILRAAQGGFPVVRASHGGFSQILGPRGRVLAEASFPSLEPTVLVAQVPLPD